MLLGLHFLAEVWATSVKQNFLYFPSQANQQGVPQGNVPPPKPAPTQPAVMQATQEPPPPYTAQSDAQITAQAATDDLKRRQEELERKAEELQRKEQELQRNMGYQGNYLRLVSFILTCGQDMSVKSWPCLDKVSPVCVCVCWEAALYVMYTSLFLLALVSWKKHCYVYGDGMA